MHELGHGILKVVWMHSHLTYEAAINQGYSVHYWVANRFADQFGVQAASLRQLVPSLPAHKLTEETSTARVTLLHHIEIAMHLAPSGARAAQTIATGVPAVLIGEQVRKMARLAGHKLNEKDKFVGCNMQIPMQRNLTYLETILHMKCVSQIGNMFPSVVLHNTDKSSDTYLLGKIRASASHCMATDYGLRIHFCTFCGAYRKVQDA